MASPSGRAPPASTTHRIPRSASFTIRSAAVELTRPAVNALTWTLTTCVGEVSGVSL